MKNKLINYVDELKKEYQSCFLYDNKLKEERSDNYYYHTRAKTILEIIYSLYDIIKENE